VAAPAPGAPRVANKAGLNMFAWNMRYPDAVAFWAWWASGRRADGAAGVYQVRLRAGGRTATQRFTLKLDPRSKVTRSRCARSSPSCNDCATPSTRSRLP